MKKKHYSWISAIMLLWRSKLLKTMRLTLFAIFVSVVQVFATNAYSQQTRLSLNLRKTTIRNVLKHIEDQTDYFFIYNARTVDVDKTINGEFDDKSVSEILDKIFGGTDIIYKIDKRQIAISTNLGVDFVDQTVSVLGRVMDQSGEPLPGVTVLVKGTTQGTISDFEGNYTIENVPIGGVLVFSFVGMRSQEVVVGNQSSIDIVMQEDAIGLDEVVAIGYGTQSRSNVVGAIATVDATEIQDSPTASLTNAFAGRLPGVYIQQGGGKPGFASSIQIRARGSFNDTEPLFVIDGVIRDKFAFDGLDVSEIESVSVLKDGASAAVYGNKAANGVILVTTKMGQKGQKAQINFSSKFSIDKPINIPKTESAYDQARFINDNILGSNKFDRSLAEKDGRWYTEDELEYFKQNSFNWIDEFWEDPMQQQYTLNVSGGTENIRYFLGGAYYDATGSFDNLEFNRYNLRANVEVDISDNLTVGLNLSNSVRNDEKPFWRWDGDDDLFQDLYKAMLFRTSTVPPYIDGKPVGTYVEWHPGEIIDDVSGFNRKKWNDLNAIISLNYKVPFVEGLALGLKYNNFNRSTFIKQFNLPYQLYLFETKGGNNHILSNKVIGQKTRSDGNWLDELYYGNSSNQLNFSVDYNKRIANHEISALYVYEQGERFQDYFQARNQDYTSSVVAQLDAGSASDERSRVWGNGSEFGRKSHVGRLRYSYDDRYILETAFRADASTRFAPSDRWGFFPSISGGWKVSNEDFFDVDFISNLKIKASYAEVGSDGGKDVGNFEWLPSFSYSDGALFGEKVALGVNSSGLANPSITWEVSKTWNAGFEAFFLENRLSAIFDVYSRQNSGILDARIASTPVTFGADLPDENYARVDSKGFEIALQYRNQLRNGFKYNLGFNLGYATNEQVIRDEASGLRPYQKREGRELDLFFGYQSAGILRTQEDLDALPKGYTIFGQEPTLGQLNYVDIRGEEGDTPDGKITAADQEFLGRSTPPVNYGISLNGSWKGFSLDLFFQGLAGHKEMVDFRWAQARPVEKNFAFWNDHWTPENTDAAYPRAWNNLAGEASTFWLRDGSFLRLKNATFGYSLPKSMLASSGIANVKFYVNGVNLLLLQNKVKFKDPEAESIRSYPLFRTFTFGINVTI